MSGKEVKVGSWEDFRDLIDEYDPRRIIYSIEKEATGNQVAILSFVLQSGKARYVFTDSLAGDRLRETGIPLHRDELGNARIRDEDVVRFVKSETSRRDAKIISYWTRAQGKERLASAGEILLGRLSDISQEQAGVESEIRDNYEALMNKARALLEED
jgi:hypothetical protein